MKLAGTINFDYGEQGIKWSVLRRSLEWLNKKPPTIAKIWTNSVDIENIGLSRAGE